MILINSTLTDGRIQPIPHKGDNHERDGEIMTEQELHEFGLGLLIVYLYKQKGELIRANDSYLEMNIHILLQRILKRGVAIYLG